MTVQRRPSTPPVIPGLADPRLLGMGGFADVFLYEQQMPRRAVAVKVLLADGLGADVLARFGTEADLMAQLSHHPSIVTIHEAAVAADGRPYLVMEYCSRPGLGARYRTERIPVAEALRIGIRLASAVETAHRGGILHRDIKPANVLTTDFGWPALTDFGIAATTAWTGDSAVGMSIPWSPPEMLAAEPAGDVRADVYSLAATVYSLLAGRSPFEVPGGANGAADLVARIERAPLPRTGRTDVPASLQAALARAMAKNPVHRFHSALALARALQGVERELMLPGTPVELAQDALEPTQVLPTVPVADDDARTRLRPVVSIDPEGAADHDDAAPSVTPAAGPVRSAAEEAATATRVRPVTSISPEGARPAARVDVPTFAAPAPALAPVAGSGTSPSSTTLAAGDDVRPRAGRAHRAVTSLAAVVVAAAIAGSAALALGDDRPTAAVAAGTDAPTGVTAAVTAVPSPVDLRAQGLPDGSTVVTWTNPQPLDGDRYLWGVVRAGAPTELQLVDGPTVTVPGTGEPVCLEVSVVRADRRASTRPAVVCSP